MAAGFLIVRDDRNKGSVELPISSASPAVGDLYELTAGSANWAAVTSSSNHFTRKAIVTRGGTSVTSIEAIVLDGNELVEVQSVNNSAAADNGDRMAATDANTVNNSGTDVTGQAVVFQQIGVVGAAADKRILGYVITGNGVDPDAA